MSEIVVLVTDYGLADHYAASLVGSCLRVDPTLRVEHGTHEVPFGDVLAAAYHLSALAADYPRGTVFCGVVDPGVGTERGAVAVDVGGVRCVAPDTGLVHWIWEDAAHGARSAVGLAIPVGAAPTFHGRDVFAPAAAQLASGLSLHELGERQVGPRLLDTARVVVEGDEAVCRVALVDHFGNVVTTLRQRDVGAGEALAGARWHGGETATVARTYAEIGAGVAVVVGGSGHVELAADSRSAALMSDLRPGDMVRILLRRSAA